MENKLELAYKEVFKNSKIVLSRSDLAKKCVMGAIIPSTRQKRRN